MPGAAGVSTVWRGKSVGLGCACVDAMEGGKNINSLVCAPAPPQGSGPMSPSPLWGGHKHGWERGQPQLDLPFQGTVQGRPPMGSSEEPMCFLSSRSQHFQFLPCRGNSGQSGLHRITVTPIEKWRLPHLTTEGSCDYNQQGRGKTWKELFFLFSLHPARHLIPQEGRRQCVREQFLSLWSDPLPPFQVSSATSQPDGRKTESKMRLEF